MNRCRSSGDCGLAGIIPFFTIHDCTSGAAKNGTTSDRSLFTICAGVFAGATSMIQPTASKPGTPASAMVGMFGAETSRVLDDTASARTFPSRSEEHTSELQSLRHLVCRLLLE